MSDIGFKETHTAILINAINCPFVTLTESKVPNHWYHPNRDEIFMLTPSGFKCIRGSKSIMKKDNLL